MYIFHDVSSDDCMEVGLHKIENQINVFVVFSFEDVEQRNDVRMAIEFLKKDDLRKDWITSR